MIVYSHAIKSFNDFEFAAAFINICNKFHPETTKEVKSSIFEDLKLRFGSCEDYWNLIALNQLQEYKQTTRFTAQLAELEHLKLKQEALGKVISTFENACLIFDNAKMWSFYISFRQVFL